MDEVIIVDYNLLWPVLFEQEAIRLRQFLNEKLIICVEHFGSTAVPGLAAKPIIDLLVGVHSLAQAKQVAVPPLEALGYSYWRDNPDPGRMFFVQGLPPNGPRTHHIHMVELNSLLWERLLFRDFLRKYPDEAKRYAYLKCDLAHQFQRDREAYTNAKAEYIQSVMQKARQEFPV